MSRFASRSSALLFAGLAMQIAHGSWQAQILPSPPNPLANGAAVQSLGNQWLAGYWDDTAQNAFLVTGTSFAQLPQPGSPFAEAAAFDSSHVVGFVGNPNGGAPYLPYVWTNAAPPIGTALLPQDGASGTHYISGDTRGLDGNIVIGVASPDPNANVSNNYVACYWDLQNNNTLHELAHATFTPPTGPNLALADSCTLCIGGSSPTIFGAGDTVDPTGNLIGHCLQWNGLNAQPREVLAGRDALIYATDGTTGVGYADPQNVTSGPPYFVPVALGNLTAASPTVTELPVPSNLQYGEATGVAGDFVSGVLISDKRRAALWTFDKHTNTYSLTDLDQAAVQAATLANPGATVVCDSSWATGVEVQGSNVTIVGFTRINGSNFPVRWTQTHGPVRAARTAAAGRRTLLSQAAGGR